MKGSGDEEMCVEALGILGNLLLPEVDFERVVSQLELMPFIVNTLKVSLLKCYILKEKRFLRICVNPGSYSFWL